MWDLDTLHYLNEQAWLSSRKMVHGGRAGSSLAAGPEPVFPLSILARKLITGPPSLVRIIDLIENSESIADFLELIREYIPTHEAEIMAAVDDADRVRGFCRYFENQYFPLEEAMWETGEFEIAEFVHHIPVELMGFTEEDYHEFNSYRDGFILLLAVVESPFMDGDPARVAVLEGVKELVGKYLAGLIPPNGWSGETLHLMLDGTEYEGCATFADWVHGSTGCWQLDSNYMDYGPEEWNREIVDGLTEQRTRVIDLQEKMQAMYIWLEEDIHHNFGRLLAAILDDDEVFPQIPKEQLELPLGFD